MATRPVRPQPRELRPQLNELPANSDRHSTSAGPVPASDCQSENVDLAAEPTCFTNEPSGEPWVLTPADAEAVIDSWNNPRPPSDYLKAACAQYMEQVREA
jgi:hypothetical protein